MDLVNTLRQSPARRVALYWTVEEGGGGGKGGGGGLCGTQVL